MSLMSCTLKTTRHTFTYIARQADMTQDKRTYSTWAHMKSRCRNPKDVRYPDYGGRGITFQASWDSYSNFVQDMGPSARR